ncbi:YiiX/YebB-like N1pC/P60 family cysteine hydrolase [Rhodoblastus sp.]|uniref:YiiX/YebB-like N1pC/P60 family cysteine hydrolase n=1 Tax=Rhodoblastus sp. TaxID=1962975 RepID=UPI003F97CAD9
MTRAGAQDGDGNEGAMFIFDAIGGALADFLTKERDIRAASPPTPPELLLASLRPGDVLLVEGSARISSAIKYLTQSTWSHAALYAGPAKGCGDHCLIEADLVEGVRRVGVARYAGLHTRICRPVGLDDADRRAVIDFAEARLGSYYDLRNVFDLARYLLPNPPIPSRWRRRMLALGSGDPTRAICSTLIAQAFQSIQYPILPDIERVKASRGDCEECVEEILHIRHYSLFTPRDFDVSPFFEIVKPTLEGGVNFRTVQWADAREAVA